MPRRQSLVQRAWVDPSTVTRHSRFKLINQGLSSFVPFSPLSCASRLFRRRALLANQQRCMQDNNNSTPSPALDYWKKLLLVAPSVAICCYLWKRASGCRAARRDLRSLEHSTMGVVHGAASEPGTRSRGGTANKRVWMWEILLLCVSRCATDPNFSPLPPSAFPRHWPRPILLSWSASGPIPRRQNRSRTAADDAGGDSAVGVLSLIECLTLRAYADHHISGGKASNVHARNNKEKGN